MRKVLEFLRLVDPNDGLLSLTSIALIVVIAKIATTHDASMVDLGALLLALANYNVKKVLNAQAAEAAATPQDALGELSAKVEELRTKMNAMSVRVGLGSLFK